MTTQELNHGVEVWPAPPPKKVVADPDARNLDKLGKKKRVKPRRPQASVKAKHIFDPAPVPRAARRCGGDGPEGGGGGAPSSTDSAAQSGTDSDSDDSGCGGGGEPVDGGGIGVPGGVGGGAAAVGGVVVAGQVHEPRARVARAAGQARAAAGMRAVDVWHGFTISELHTGGLQVGWEISCGRHSNGDGDPYLCKKSITFGSGIGRSVRLTDEQCITGLKRWVLNGIAMVGVNARDRHLDVNARLLARTPPVDGEDLDGEAVLLLGL